jgi:LacI family transcriptional regulator
VYDLPQEAVRKMASDTHPGTVTPAPVTRDDVARRAGVSSATVSRVFNNPDQVAHEKCRAVLDAARELGYRPNKSASALRRRATGVIALVEFAKPHRRYYWGALAEFSWFYAEMVKGIEAALQNTMYSLRIIPTAGAKAIREAAEFSDGIICFDVDMIDEAQSIRNLGVPYIISHHTASFSGYERCSTDNREGGRLQARLLYAQGAKRPLYITGLTEEVKPHADRLEGFLESWGEYAADAGQPTVIMVEPGEGGGAAASVETAGLFRSRACDGAAAVNDITLIGVLNGLARSGELQLLNGLPLCGYDAVPFRTLLPYRFSSIDIQPGLLYRRAADLLLERLSGRHPVSSPIEIVVPPIAVPAEPDQQIRGAHV